MERDHNHSIAYLGLVVFWGWCMCVGGEALALGGEGEAR